MTNIRLADDSDFGRIDALIQAYHLEQSITLSDEDRKNAILPLLQGTPMGVIYLIGPATSPVGYAAVTFRWSIATGGLGAVLDQIYIREKIRGRGMGRDTISKICVMLRENGVTSMSLQLPQNHDRLHRFFGTLGFKSNAPLGAMVQSF